MTRAASSPAFNGTGGSSFNAQGGSSDDGVGELGELHIRRRMTAAKERQRSGRQRLEDIMRQSREPGEANAISRLGNQWLGADRKPGKAVTIDSQPKYVGQQANELSKWMNAESISRYKEEMNLGVPTLRQVLKVDDDIGMRQMTKSQLAALPFDPTDSRRGPKRDPTAKQRGASYRALIKS
eukprot:CAMPEP_0179064604 /NCGR_PEP_ID=MMETSP0796-20121207/28032_1 /TAXON_ID=73915 /ORGANISM="Pyrodinium bahamense, Strain pbaha01" /LENGTH=181 /DNA_ID=CAMNT_0020761553 /DNA_START=95 /DNA_END=640 /DNA_ORIENTATION=+